MLSHHQVSEVVMPPGKGKKRVKTSNPKSKYEYDPEWLKKVLKSICPQCDNPLERKGIKRECSTHHHLEIYGNPVLVAFKETVEEKELPKPSYDVCPECGSSVFFEDVERHEVYCRCGLVLSGPYQFGIDYPFHEVYIDV